MGDGRDFVIKGPEYVTKLNIVRFCFWFPILVIIVVIDNCYHNPPDFKLPKFYVPALDKSVNSSKNTRIAIDFYFGNKEVTSKVYLDPINVTIYDGPTLNHSIANIVIPEFFLEGVESPFTSSEMVNTTGFDLDGAKQEISANRFKVFRVGLETSVRYQYYFFWKTKRREYRRGVDVKISDTGGVAKFGNNFVGIRALFMFNFMVLVFLSSY